MINNWKKINARVEHFKSFYSKENKKCLY